MKTVSQGAFAGSRLVTSLFVLLVVLQLLDLHATLTASAHQVERNRLITWLSQLFPFGGVVTAIKGLDLLLVALMYGVWRTTAGRLNIEFAVGVGTAVLVYLAVVTNNYLR